MKRLALIAFICAAATRLSAQKTYAYESVPNDPINVRIYTLDNGLKVYMSVDKNEPMIKVTIATKAGSKLDPEETTGLAHYFEHLMFKGTKQFGTKDYAKEEPLLNEIERLFEEYRKIDEKETAKRNRLFRTIDSLSQVASRYVISNEYDKLMSVIGSKGTNAATWVDFTNYYEEIPSNQLENYLIIQADRFSNPVLRTFHTELETIYEEKNMNLASDGRRVNTALFEGLFPSHPYGTQTTIGTQQHLRNPSITNIKKFFDTYYVPNNMAFVMSGDLDPEATIALIDKYFGQKKSAPLPEFKFTPEKPITSPIVKEVTGKEAEYVMLAWRFGNPNSAEIPLMTLAEMVLTNGHAGLVDLNVNQKQLVQGAGSSVSFLHDYSMVEMFGQPKKGQTLDDVRDILLNQIDSLQQGKFDEWLLDAIITDLRMRQTNAFEDNDGRVDKMEESFYLDIPWKNMINEIDVLSKITKEQIVDFAKKYLGRNNYVIVYKRKGAPKDIDKVKKPKITPIKINRDAKSDFVKMIEDRKVPDIQPEFIDFQKDLTTTQAKNNTTVYYTKNTENDLFILRYVFDLGSFNDKYLGYAAGYMQYLGTDKLTPEQVKQEFYKLGCTYKMQTSSIRSFITIQGLSKNMEKAMQLFEEIAKNMKPNKEALKNLVDDVLKSREDAKDNPNAIFGNLVAYGTYGWKNSPVSATLITEKELNAMTPEFLIGKIQNWLNYKHFVIYHGPQSQGEVVASINKTHNLENLKDVPPEKIFKQEVPTKTRVFVVHNDLPQLRYYSKSFGGNYQIELSPRVNMYNAYFGGSMNSIVFQEMREARSLAYTAYSSYQAPDDKIELYENIAYIGCATDKMKEAIQAFDTLMTNMPLSEDAFKTAQKSTISDFRTARTRPEDVVWRYLAWKRLGLNEDPRRKIFAALPSVTLSDIKKFQEEYIVGKPQTIVIMGDVNEMDMNFLNSLGKVTQLKLKDIFGY